MNFGAFVQSLRNFVEAATERLDYSSIYAYTVRSQHADDSVDVAPDNSRLPPLQFRPLDFGLPASSAKLANGARVFVQFEDADPKKARIVGYGTGTAGVNELAFFGGTKSLARVSDTANCGTLTLAVAGSVLSGTYIDPDGRSTPIVAGTPFAVTAKIDSNGVKVKA